MTNTAATAKHAPATTEDVTCWLRRNGFTAKDGHFVKGAATVFFEDGQVNVLAFEDEKHWGIIWDAKITSAPLAAVAALITSAV
jgi:hypothetical protein